LKDKFNFPVKYYMVKGLKETNGVVVKR